MRLWLSDRGGGGLWFRRRWGRCGGGVVDDMGGGGLRGGLQGLGARGACTHWPAGYLEHKGIAGGRATGKAWATAGLPPWQFALMPNQWVVAGLAVSYWQAATVSSLEATTWRLHACASAENSGACGGGVPAYRRTLGCLYHNMHSVPNHTPSWTKNSGGLNQRKRCCPCCRMRGCVRPIPIMQSASLVHSPLLPPSHPGPLVSVC